ncbi:hypothetical protein QZH45_04700 [Pseudomonas corrugata]|uniref:hypothetical protein n=1 Tax=Pseudomonas corrugata TaxID=47879 RepID=UPI00083D7494|nr:hypothetical protein [Pseudomonas corrugata]AOE63760.1 hypothetical protein AXG94_19015 [Pseudomonas corrugata]
MSTSAQKIAGISNEFAGLGARLVRLGHALQEPSTTVNELAALAMACGIKLQMRAVADSEDRVATQPTDNEIVSRHGIR